MFTSIVKTIVVIFEINRCVVFYNGITNEYILTIEGRCSLGNYDISESIIPNIDIYIC